MDINIKPVKVKYQGKDIIIDIQKELSIDKNKLDSQLRDIPSSYFILCNIRDKYIRRREELAKEKDVAYSEAWNFYKNANPQWNNDYVSNKANTNHKYISRFNAYLKMAEKAAQFISLCKAYESRENVIRTLSANLRKQ